MSERNNTMQFITVKKDALITVLKGNLDNHKNIFAKAYEEYRRIATIEFEAMLKQVKENGPVIRAILIPQPKDHSSDYTQAIRMLEMSVHEEFDLDASDFQRFVMDDWGWKREWMETTTAYSSGQIPGHTHK